MSYQDSLIIPATDSGRLNYKGEMLLYWRISAFMKANYPDVIYRFDLAAGMTVARKTKAGKEADELLRRFRLAYSHEKGYPDFFIPEPVGGYSGFYMEVKREKTRIKKKDGSFANHHIGRQYKYLLRLKRLGFYVCFGVGDKSFYQISKYLSGAV